MAKYQLKSNPTYAEFATGRDLRIYPRNLAMLPDGRWRDNAQLGAQTGGVWYAFLRGSQPTQWRDPKDTSQDRRTPGVGLLDRITCAVLGPSVAQFYAVRGKHFPLMPKIVLVWTPAAKAATLTNDAVPIALLMEDPVGPIDFIDGARLMDSTEAPSTTKYRSSWQSDFAIEMDVAGNATAFTYADWVAPAPAPVTSGAWLGATLSDQDLVDATDGIVNGPFAVSDKARRLRALYGRS